MYQSHFEDWAYPLFKYYDVYAENITSGYAGDSNLIVQANSDMIWGINHGIPPSFQVSVVGDYTTLGAVGLLVHTEDASVPEPGTWALMLAGVGLAGAALRRQRRFSVG